MRSSQPTSPATGTSSTRTSPGARRTTRSLRMPNRDEVLAWYRRGWASGSRAMVTEAGVYGDKILVGLDIFDERSEAKGREPTSAVANADRPRRPGHRHPRIRGPCRPRRLVSADASPLRPGRGPLRSLPAGALAVRAPRPAAGPALAFLQLLLGAADAALPGRLLLGVLDPADELVAGQRRDVPPGIECRGVGDQRLAQVCREACAPPRRALAGLLMGPR